MKKVFITGSTGLLGSALLANIPKDIDVAGSIIRTRLVPNNSKIKYYVLDIRDAKGVKRVFNNFKPDYVIHTAAQANVDYCETHKEEAWEVNVEATRNIINAANDVGATVVFTSTNSIYDGLHPLYTEEDQGNPIDYYGVTKTQSESDLVSKAKSYLLVRLITMIGWNNPQERANPITWLLPKFKNKEDVYMTTDLFNNFLPVWSASEAIWKMILENRKNEVFNLAGKDVHNRYELATEAAKAFNYKNTKITPVSSDFFPSLTTRPPDTSFNVTKMEKNLKVKAWLLKEALQWMKSHEPGKDAWEQLPLSLEEINKKVLISSHFNKDENGEKRGILHTISEFLLAHGVEHTVVKHPLTTKGRSIVEKLSEKKAFKEEKGTEGIKPPFSYIQHFFFNLSAGSKGYKIYIGIDPLNAMSGVILKWLGRIDQVVYLSADYSPVRFNNPILNFIYQTFDVVSAKNADYCWSISSRIMQIREKQGVKAYKNYFVPDNLGLKMISPNKVDKYSIVAVSDDWENIEIKPLLVALKELRSVYPDIKITFIGSKGIESIKHEAQTQGVTSLTKFLPGATRESLAKVLEGYGVGVAFMEKKPGQFYSDSLAVRDYLSFGIPVFMFGDTSATADIQQSNAGKEVLLTNKSITNAFLDLWQNDAHYEQIRKNAINLAKTNDIESTLTKTFARFITRPTTINSSKK